MTEKRSARIAMGWKRIGLMRRPAAGGEDRERDSFFMRYQIDWAGDEEVPGVALVSVKYFFHES